MDKSKFTAGYTNIDGNEKDLLNKFLQKKKIRIFSDRREKENTQEGRKMNETREIHRMSQNTKLHGSSMDID